MKSIAERLKEAMILRDMKQADLVACTKISKGALSSYLSGKYDPKQTNIFKLAKALNVNEAWLMGYDVNIDRKDMSVASAQHDFDLLYKFSLLNESDQELVRGLIDSLIKKAGF